MKERKFKSYDEMLEHIQDGKKVKNVKNFIFFSFDKIGKKLHLGRYLLLQKQNGSLYIEYCTVEPDDKVVSYANIIHEDVSM